MKVNKRPIDGNCTVTEPTTRLALVDIYKIECRNWVDPENKGISLYSVYIVSTVDGVKTPLLDIKFNPTVPHITDLILPPGIFDVMVHIVDKMEAYTVYTAKTGMEVLMPTQEQVEAANVDGKIAALSGAGNTALLTMVIAAQASVSAEEL
ncbi:hypothetical protein SK128_002077 [Halocaridina rubra]|uniref:PKD/REJ-like domain-containing protein n=1 Tax=Halocaridina rubra TaxID=373956 RepID=A0AAN8X7B0_HALRR